MNYNKSRESEYNNQNTNEFTKQRYNNWLWCLELLLLLILNKYFVLERERLEQKFTWELTQTLNEEIKSKWSLFDKRRSKAL